MTAYEKTQARVKEWMSSHVVSIRADANVHEAIQAMQENRISALPIVDKNNRCIGIVTTTDLLDIIYEVDDDVTNTDPVDPYSRRRLIDHLVNTVGKEPIATYMSEQVTTALDSTTLAVAARLMVNNQVHHLPIVDARDELVGVLSSMDILGQVADDD